MAEQAKFRDGALDEIVAEFRECTPASAAHWARWREVIPNWNERAGAMAPYPVYVRSGSGVHLEDLDGRAILDFVCSNMGGVLGHGNDEVRAALHEQLDRGTNFSMLPDRELELAELLVDRVPSVERVRFTATGSESTMMALRVARASTGRPAIAKVDGGYHGTHDAVWFGSPRHPPGTLAPGIPERIRDEVVLLAFNDLEGTDEILRAKGHELAAVIVEPVLGAGGSLPATPEYLQLLRDRTTELGIVLIFDEMISLGMARGGAQEHYGVTPDMTTAGKSFGGGIPMAFYGGRADLMGLTGRGPDGEWPQVEHVGTYVSMGLGMAAGVASLRQQTPEHFERLAASGDLIRHRLAAMADRRDFPLRVLGIGHMWGWGWHESEIRTYRDAREADSRVPSAVQTAVLNRGFLVGPGRGIVTAVHTESQIDSLVDAIEATLDRLVE